MGEPDLSEFLELATPTKKRCRVAIAKDGLSPEDRRALDAALAEDKTVISATAIIKWLRARNQEMSNAAVGHHRNGNCSCG